MALFRYQALSKQGGRLSGVIDADSFPMAKEKLRRQEVFITSLSMIEKDRKEIVLEGKLLLSFTKELGQLLRAGLPLYESLVTIEEKHRGEKIHPLFLDLCDSLKGGSSLSAVLKKYPKSFDTVYLSMVSAGEETGSIEKVLDQLSLLISRQQKLKKQLISTLAYPAFLGIFCILVICGLLFFVIPSMQELFEGRRLHPLTQCVLSLSQWINAHVQTLVVSLASLIAAIFILLRRKETQIALQKLYLKIPFCKSLIIHSGLVRFCQSSSMLLSGGVPLVEALALSRKTIKCVLLEEVILEAEKRIVEGQPLSVQLGRSPFIPRLVPRILSIAEETGNMGQMMKNIAEIYEEEMEKNLAYLTTFLQPVLLIFLGGIVGVVVLSILLPLTDVSSFLSG
ncbi:MAG TPA: type II secretion system F family protein [Rhabdochlamydiaceae bacterium]|nr:type II secretion system F family protein [Rhabdochlamydiaceae bacterium]